MWNYIKDWYLQHGFTAAADNMKEIKQVWDGREHHLYAILRNYGGL